MNRSSKLLPARDPSHTQITFGLFAICFLVYAISPQGRPAYSDLLHGAEITRVALSVVQEGSFAHPFHSLPTGPTAHTAPAYVLLYAAVAQVFGLGLAGARALWIVNVGLLALQLALLPRLSSRLGLGAGPGVLAALFGIVVQPYRVLVEWESIFTGALLVCACLLTWDHFAESRTWQRSLLLGFLWGGVLLTNPACILLLLAWAYVAAIKNTPQRLAQAQRAALVTVAGAALACLPWFIRNYQQFHSVFLVRDNFGLELYTSNNPCAEPTVLENVISGCHAKTHPNANADLAGEVIDKGEVGFNRDCLHQAMEWIDSNRAAFASLTARRFLKFWFPYLGGLRYAIPTGILTILSFAGLPLMYRNHRPAAMLFASTLFLYPLIHYFVQFEARYRYPIFWATFLPAAFACIAITERVRRFRGSAAIHREQSNFASPIK